MSAAGGSAWEWRSEDLGRGLALLADEAGLDPLRPSETSTPMPADPERFRPWVLATAAWQQLEAEPISATYGELDRLVASAGPALLCLRTLGTDRDPPAWAWALLIGPAPGFRRAVRLLGTDGDVHTVSAEALAARLAEPLEAESRESTEALLARAKVPERRRKKALDLLLSRRLAETPVAVGYLLRPSPGSDFRSRLSRAGAFRGMAALVIGHALQYVLFLLSWWLMGRAALGGTLAAGWLVAWGLLLLSLVPLRMATSWIMGSLSIRVGAELKRRLLHGALSLDRDAMRSEGAGAALGRVIEAEAVESLALGGGLMTLTALIELPFALWVLSQGTAGGALVALFGVVGLWALWAVLRFHRALGTWVDRRLTMTQGLVEKMAGHETRLVQEADRRQHRGEDLELKEYLDRLSRLDRSQVSLLLLPRGWMVAALLVVGPYLAAGGAGVGLAVTVGGLLLMQGILTSLSGGLTHLGAAWISWRRVEPLFRAAGRRTPLGLPHLTLEAPSASEDGASVDDEAPVVMSGRGLAYRYAARSRPVLRDAELVVRQGDRILLEGPSGGGKSTLASLLVGLREPTAGTLALHGVDLRSMGLDAWRRRVVLVPQFHDNHVLTETFAFNLLMGRGWPPDRTGLFDAWQVCHELGLGELLQRMPGGLQQMVGETGWQLSHGERSRLYLARALLQDADLLILDESFAALDPENLQLAMDCARKRGRTVLVIAHP